MFFLTSSRPETVLNHAMFDVGLLNYTEPGTLPLTIAVPRETFSMVNHFEKFSLPPNFTS